MSLHVCHITTIHPWDDTRIFQKQCITAADAGYRVTLLVGNGPTKTDKGVEIIGVEWKAKSRLVRFKRAAKALYEAASRVDADIFEFHDPEFLPYAEKLVRAGKRVIYDAHEDVPRQILGKYYIPKPARKIVSKRFERLENKVVPQLSGLFTATTHIRDRFLSMNKNAVDLHNYPNLVELGQPAPFDQKPREICYIGRLTNIRGAREMVIAMEGLDIKLNIGGDFSPESLHEEVKKYDGWENVNYHGFLERTKVKDVLDRSRLGLVVLHPTINYVDALPVKMFEYMAAGIPVISSNIPLWQGIVDEAGCGLCVDPLNTIEIRRAIETLVDDEHHSIEMGINGRKAVEEKYNWDAEKAKMFELYETVLGL